MPSQVPAVLSRSYRCTTGPRRRSGPLSPGAPADPVAERRLPAARHRAVRAEAVGIGKRRPKPPGRRSPFAAACAQLTQGPVQAMLQQTHVRAEARVRTAIRRCRGQIRPASDPQLPFTHFEATLIVVRGAGRSAGAGVRIAVERGADDGRPGGAGPATVADPAPADRRAAAGARLAGGPEDEAAAGAGAVAHPIEAAGRRVRGRADTGAARRSAGRHERAHPRCAGVVAGLAGFGTGAVTADAVDAEATGAVPVAPAGGAVGPAHLVGAAAGDRRRIAAGVGDRPVGAGGAPEWLLHPAAQRPTHHSTATAVKSRAVRKLIISRNVSPGPLPARRVVDCVRSIVSGRLRQVDCVRSIASGRLRQIIADGGEAGGARRDGGAGTGWRLDRGLRRRAQETRR